MEGLKLSDISLNGYQDEARKTAIYPDLVALDYTILGLCGECGELANLRKKHLRKPLQGSNRYVHAEDLARRAALADELGDVLWYLSQVAHELGYDLETIARMNMKKLAARMEAGTLDAIDRKETKDGG